MLYFKNPENGHIEQVTDNSSKLGFILFGPLYYLYKGAWRTALIFFIAYPCIIAFGGFIGATIGTEIDPDSVGYGVIPIILAPVGLLCLVSLSVEPEIERVYQMKGWTKVDSKGNKIR